MILARKVLESVTNLVTTTPGSGRRNATPPDAISFLPAIIRLDATSSDESSMHGKEKVYGSIP
jgi:hypothetical protein